MKKTLQKTIVQNDYRKYTAHSLFNARYSNTATPNRCETQLEYR